MDLPFLNPNPSGAASNQAPWETPNQEGSDDATLNELLALYQTGSDPSPFDAAASAPPFSLDPPPGFGQDSAFPPFAGFGESASQEAPAEFPPFAGFGEPPSAETPRTSDRWPSPLQPSRPAARRFARGAHRDPAPWDIPVSSHLPVRTAALPVARFLRNRVSVDIASQQRSGHGVPGLQLTEHKFRPVTPPGAYRSPGLSPFRAASNPNGVGSNVPTTSTHDFVGIVSSRPVAQ